MAAMGRQSWKSPRRFALVALVLLSHGIEAAEIRHRDGVHRAAKVDPLVTPAPFLEKRDQTACPTSYSLCPPNLSGGCCGDGYSCAVDSCYATTEGPVTCAGRVGYHACGVEFGGGCCPVGSVCERGSRCMPAPGVSYSHECGASSYLCPESLGFGCCKDGLACGQDRCYSTEASTLVFTQTLTTTEDDSKITTTTTVTTVSTPTDDGDATEMPSDEELHKFYPTAVEKVEPIVTEEDDDDDDDSGGGGLSSGQIGGVVAGIVIFLIIVILAAILIIRRLNRVAKAVEETKPEPDDRRETQEYFKPGDAEIESITTSGATPRSRFRSGTTDSDSEAPTLFGFPSPGSPGDSAMSSRRHSHRSSGSSSGGRMTVSSWTRNNSVRSSPGRALSDGFVTPVSPDPEPAELEARSTPAELSGDVSPIPELPNPVPSTARMSRGKDGAAHGHKRSISAATPQLDVVSEDGEYHGYYGPLDKVAGQTTTTPTGARPAEMPGA